MSNPLRCPRCSTVGDFKRERDDDKFVCQGCGTWAVVGDADLLDAALGQLASVRRILMDGNKHSNTAWSIVDEALEVVNASD